MLYDAISDLSLSIDDCELRLHEQDTSSGFTRTTTIMSLKGGNDVGRGEDVTYASDAHYQLRDAPFPDLTGEFTFEEFTEHLAAIDWFFGETPDQQIFRNYRQWALESAALDLALKQAGTNLGAFLDRTYDPVRFVVSTRLREPPTGELITEWLDKNPSLEFKLDPTSDWDTSLIERLQDTGAVRTLDLKGQYHGTIVDQPADPALYQRVIDGFPDALIEDPALTAETTPLFAGHEHRVTWDYPIRDIESIEDLLWEPQWLNIKPSRFGSVHSLFDTIDYCTRHNIQLFGGGQFELGVGREHLHTIASLFYPDAPNDVAPTEYNTSKPNGKLPTSPLTPPKNPSGLEWN